GYTLYLRRSPDAEVAAGLIAIAAQLQGSAAGTAMAARRCAATPFPASVNDSAACTAALIARSGDDEAATRLLAQQAAQHPDDLVMLRDLAWKGPHARPRGATRHTR